MKRFTALAIAVVAVAAGAVAMVGGGVAGAASSLPTLTIALSGNTVTVGGSQVSGAVTVQTTVSGANRASVALFRFNPGVSPAQFAQGIAAVGQHHGDLNYLNPYGSLIYSAAAPKGTSSAQTILQPGSYIALKTQNGGGPPPHAFFTVTANPSPATLPTPGATEASIDFGFVGPKTLHEGELVRFVNNGFVVHMDSFAQVKNVVDAKKVIALLKAGKDGKAMKLAIGGGTFQGPVSSGGLQQETITAKPGVYVQACFMNTQDGREHTRLGMVRMIKIVQ